MNFNIDFFPAHLSLYNDYQFFNRANAFETSTMVYVSSQPQVDYGYGSTSSYMESSHALQHKIASFYWLPAYMPSTPVGYFDGIAALSWQQTPLCGAPVSDERITTNTFILGCTLEKQNQNSSWLTLAWGFKIIIIT